MHKNFPSEVEAPKPYLTWSLDIHYASGLVRFRCVSRWAAFIPHAWRKVGRVRLSFLVYRQ